MSKWYSDAPISSPKPHGVRELVSMQGFVFTENGIAHEITDQQYFEVFVPKTDAIDPTETIFLDKDLDTEFI